MASIHVIYASTSGHTEYVVGVLLPILQAEGHTVSVYRAEQAASQDLQACDFLILASGTWNTGGVEGQLNPHMHALLFDRATKSDLTGKKVALISLGDDRYYFTTRCTERFVQFLKSHRGALCGVPLIIINEPYGQEERIRTWGEKLVALIH